MSALVPIKSRSISPDITPNNCIAGNIGLLNDGVYHVSPSGSHLSTITVEFISMKIMILNPEASFATSPTGIVSMAIAMAAPVMTIA